MFNFSEPTGFSAVVKQAYQITASGYPLTLTKTLAKQPESITVYGASGGVGDKTANLFDIASRINNSYVDGDRNYIRAKESSWTFRVPVEGSEKYTIIAPTTKAALNGYLRYGFSENKYTSSGSDKTLINTIALNGNVFSVSRILHISAPESAKWFYITLGTLAITDDFILNMMLVEGEYTAETIPPYELYGYKIPILLSDGAINKTINLYSDTDFVEGEFLTVKPKAKAATLTNGTSVAALQDWEQDWKLPKADELTVTTGATVEPSSISVTYYSSERG